MTNVATIRILSADAPKTALRALCADYAQERGINVDIELLTAPLIRERVEAGDAHAEIVIVPLPILKELAERGFVIGDTVGVLGSVEVGVVVRNGAREPDIGSVEAFTRAILQADAVVYNKASSGLYVADMLERLGLTALIADRTVIVKTGAAVMEHLAEDPRDAIGFGHITEIRLHDDRGTHLVGPLPGEIGRTTTYAAGALSGPSDTAETGALVGHLTSPAARRAFAATGVT